MLLNLSILIFFLLFLIFAISKWKVHPFIALILTALAMAVSFGLGGKESVDVVLRGFSGTLKGIAIIIIIGAFIGEVLQDTGGAFRIANTIVKGVGKKKLPWAMGFTGYIVSIPVFVDVAYILLQPVTESLSVKSKKPVLYIGLALVAGLMVSHTLIPPTPGPLAVAELLNLDLGRMLMINIIVGVFAMIGGVLWVIFYCKNSWLEYDEKLKSTLFKDNESADSSNTEDTGNVVLDLLPIVVPIVLIGMGSFVTLEDNNLFTTIFNFLTIPLIAVLIGAFIALFQLRGPGRSSKLNALVEQAILKSALVIMITGAGGALGFVIKEAGIQNQIVDVFANFPFLGILLPFAVATILTVSTGSITVSLVGSASMLAPMIDSLPVSPEMVAALIGCGSFCVVHANSSLFWLLNRLHEIPPKRLYKTLTMQSLVMGLSGLLGVLLLKLFGF
ncbi:GntP family permease [Seonamhaeicola maritimus]|uniref:GntP family permease n=1 Tax=Seonamhaeicola maritimus TaxID=2591822 RepID=A0A5C7GEN3_9FLAO|nr:SLC13 family permease [Seonamhaeicola maritimus]TXG35148.1 GntP family permease [Seonamhaeicola maritimus]